MTETILRLAAVTKRTGYGRSSVYAKMARGEFPKEISLGPRAVGWLQSEVENWIQQRINASRATPVEAINHQ